MSLGGPLQLVPALIGAFAGAPVLARQMETGTFRFAWTQGFGRWRWALAKLAALAVVLAAAAGALGVLVSWILSQWSTKDGRFAFSGFPPGNLLNQFCSSLPPGKGGPSGEAFTHCLDQHGYTQWTSYQPASRFWPFQWIEGGWLLALSALLIAATIGLVRHRAARRIPGVSGEGPGPSGSVSRRTRASVAGAPYRHLISPSRAGVAVGGAVIPARSARC